MQFTLLPCPFKVLTGCDCPACGLQRSFLHLFQGQWELSFFMHPVPIELVLFLPLWLMARRWKPDLASVMLRAGWLVWIISTLIFYGMKWAGGACCL